MIESVSVVTSSGLCQRIWRVVLPLWSFARTHVATIVGVEFVIVVAFRSHRAPLLDTLR